MPGWNKKGWPKEVALWNAKTRNIVNQKKRVGTEELGASGTKLFWGHIYEEYNAKLSGQKAFSTYEEMRKSDAQVFATLLACELPIRSTDWFIKPGCTKTAWGEETITDKDYEIAAYVEDALFNRMEHTFDDYLRQALTMLPNGFSLFEKVYKEEGGKIYIKKMAMRLARSVWSWNRDKETGDIGITQFLQMNDEGKPANIDIPANKLIRFTFRQEGDNYEGVSILRSAYKHWYIKDTLYKLDVVKHEKQAIWIPVITLPDGHDDNDEDEAETILENLRANEKTFVILPGQDWKFEFANMSGSVIDPEKTIQHHNREISKNILAQFMELGASNSSGSYALSENQQDFFMLSLTAIAKQFAETNNRLLLRELVDLNYEMWQDQEYPTLCFNKLGDVDISTVSTALSTLASGGLITPDEDLEEHVRTTFSLPKKMEVEEGEEPLDETEEDTGEDVDEMATESETEPSDEESEAMDSETELANLEKELAQLQASEIESMIQVMASQFSDNEMWAAVFRAPISQETKDKISQGLLEYWNRHGRKTPDDLRKQKDDATTRIDSAKQKISETMDTFQKQMQPLKDRVAELTKLKDSARKGDKKKLMAGIKQVREQIKALRAQQSTETKALKEVKKEALMKKQAAQAEISRRKKAIETAIKTMREKVKSDNMTRSESIRTLAAQIRANGETMKSIREQARKQTEGMKGPQKKEIMANARAIIEGIQGENKTIRSAAQKLRDEAQQARDEATQKADYIREAADMKKKTDVKFSNPEDEKLFSEMKDIFDARVILQVQNHD